MQIGILHLLQRWDVVKADDDVIVCLIMEVCPKVFSTRAGHEERNGNYCLESEPRRRIKCSRFADLDTIK